MDGQNKKGRNQQGVDQIFRIYIRFMVDRNINFWLFVWEVPDGMDQFHIRIRCLDDQYFLQKRNLGGKLRNFMCSF